MKKGQFFWYFFSRLYCPNKNKRYHRLPVDTNIDNDLLALIFQSCPVIDRASVLLQYQIKQK